METQIYTDHNGNELKADKLLPCPFCGGKPQLMFSGNDFTKSRSVTITCTKCFCKRTIASVHHSSHWAAELSIERWNERVKY